MKRRWSSIFKSPPRKLDRVITPQNTHNKEQRWHSDSDEGVLGKRTKTKSEAINAEDALLSAKSIVSENTAVLSPYDVIKKGLGNRSRKPHGYTKFEISENVKDNQKLKSFLPPTTTTIDIAENESSDLIAELEEVRRRKKRLRVQKTKMDVSDVLEINVGGNIYHVERDTLCLAPDTMFSSMFDSESNRVPKDGQGRIFLDYDPSLIESIINHLRLKKTEETSQFSSIPEPVVPNGKMDAFKYLLGHFGLTSFFYPRNKNVHSQRNGKESKNDDCNKDMREDTVTDHKSTSRLPNVDKVEKVKLVDGSSILDVPTTIMVSDETTKYDEKVDDHIYFGRLNDSDDVFEEVETKDAQKKGSKDAEGNYNSQNKNAHIVNSKETKELRKNDMCCLRTKTDDSIISVDDTATNERTESSCEEQLTNRSKRQKIDYTLNPLSRPYGASPNVHFAENVQERYGRSRTSPMNSVQVNLTSPITNSTNRNVREHDVNEYTKRASEEGLMVQAKQRKPHGGVQSKSKENQKEPPWIVEYGGMYWCTTSAEMAEKWRMCLVMHFKQPTQQVSCPYCDLHFKSWQRLSLHLAQRTRDGNCIDCSGYDEKKMVESIVLYSGCFTYWVPDNLVNILLVTPALGGGPQDLLDNKSMVFSRSESTWYASDDIQDMAQAESQRLNGVPSNSTKSKWLRYLRLNVAKRLEKEKKQDKDKKITAAEREMLKYHYAKPWFLLCSWLKPFPAWPEDVRNVVCAA